MAEKASDSRTGDYTEPHRCGKCTRTFWAKRSWNRVSVICPKCGHSN